MASVTIILLTLITTFHILGITFAEPEVEVIDKIVTIENFQTTGSGGTPPNVEVVVINEQDKARHRQSILGGACLAHSNDPHGMEDYCTGLSDGGCGALTCCVWLNNSMCVAGDEDGPTFHTHQGQNRDVKYYRHKGKYYGDAPAKID